MLTTSIGDEVVPVISPNYDERDPIKTQICVNDFVHKYWETKSSKLYLHQWQVIKSLHKYTWHWNAMYFTKCKFPLASKKVRDKLCRGCEPCPVLGLDILQYWTEEIAVSNYCDTNIYCTSESSASIGSNDCNSKSADVKSYSPFQYLFMGAQDTFSKLHRWNNMKSVCIVIWYSEYHEFGSLISFVSPLIIMRSNK